MASDQTPHEVYREAMRVPGDWSRGMLAVRRQFGFSLTQAKEVMLQAENIAPSLAEHQARLVPALREIFDREEREERASAE